MRFFTVSFKRFYDEYLVGFFFTMSGSLKLWMIFSLPKRDCKSLCVCGWSVCHCVCVHPMNKDFSQAVIGIFYQCHFQKMVGWVVFKFFSLCWSLNRLKCDGQCLFLSYCDSCSLCEKSFFTGKECPVECAHRRSPCQKKIYYIYALGQLERLYNAISDKNKTLNLICFFSFKNQNWEMYCFLRSTKENASYLRVSMGGGFYGYRLKFWLFYGYRLIFFSYG